MKEFRNNIDVLRSSIDTIVSEYTAADTRIIFLMNERFDELYRNTSNVIDSHNFLEEKINGIQDQIDSIKNDMLVIPKMPSAPPGFPDHIPPISPLPIPTWPSYPVVYPAWPYPPNITWTSNRTDYINCSKKTTNTSKE
jgi:hypothetical protein